MPYCTECGTPVKPNSKFCPNCGFKLEPVTQKEPTPNTQSIPTQPPNTYIEQIKTIIPNLSVYKGLARYDNFNLIVTDRRSIFSKLTNDMMNKTIQKRRKNAEAEGKGFFGKWAAQMQGFNTYTDYYEGMTPDQILNENKDNYSIENTNITGLEIRDESNDDGGTNYYGVELTANGKKLKFKTQYDPTDAFNAAYHLTKR